MDPFVAHVLELMTPWAGVHARRMFGGHGLYREGRMFALVVDGTLFFKADGASRARFVAAGAQPFTYRGARGVVSVGYWSAPAAALETAAAMQPWCELAYAAALQAAPARPRRATAPRSR